MAAIFISHSHRDAPPALEIGSIVHAEPDASGNRLILIESTGGANLAGVLYSVTAHEVWYERGDDYKWFGAAFANDATIVTARHWESSGVFEMQPLSRLVAQSENALSPECRPPAPAAYQQSPCWAVSPR